MRAKILWDVVLTVTAGMVEFVRTELACPAVGGRRTAQAVRSARIISVLLNLAVAPIRTVARVRSVRTEPA